MAVRYAVLAHADLCPSVKQSTPVTPPAWILLKPIIALLMPAFWFGVVQGLWGTCKVMWFTEYSLGFTC